MLLILSDDQGRVEKQLLAFVRCYSMALPNLSGIAGIPLKALALFDHSP